VVRVFWPVLRDNVVEAGVSVEDTVADVARHAKILGGAGREVERRAGEGPDDGWPTE
jgi:hypothetical protein